MLGRRTSKRVVYGDSAEAEETHFRWEGLRLVQERRGGTTRSYVYDPNEHYTPLARITGEGGERETEYFHTDLNGTPLEVTDGEGHIRWCGKYRAWGRGIPHVRLEEERGGLAGGLNLYVYCPNPLTWIDPLGLDLHHIIPQEVWKTFKTDLKKVTGYVQNVTKKAMDVTNLIDLDKPFHGNHPAYSAYVKEKIIELIKNKSLSLTELRNLQDELKAKINAAKASGKNLNDYFKGGC